MHHLVLFLIILNTGKTWIIMQRTNHESNGRDLGILTIHVIFKGLFLCACQNKQTVMLWMESDG